MARRKWRWRERSLSSRHWGKRDGAGIAGWDGSGMGVIVQSAGRDGVAVSDDWECLFLGQWLGHEASGPEVRTLAQAMAWGEDKLAWAAREREKAGYYDGRG